MKKHLKIFIFFSRKQERTRYNETTGRFGPVMEDLFQVLVDTTRLDHVDAHFLSKICNGYLDGKECVCGESKDYDSVWIRGLKEFMWRIGYEIEFVEIPHNEGSRLHNEFSKNNPFGWTDFRAGYPQYKHRDEL